MYKPLFFLLCIIATALSCSNSDAPPNPSDVLLATVHGKPLYQSEVVAMIPEEASVQDSAMIINAFLEKWIRESLLMHEAERNLPKDLKIDELVRDYRASLIRHNYEKVLVELQLDSTITAQQLQTYYEENKEQYQTDQPIIRCIFIELPVDGSDIKEADKIWKAYLKNKNLTELTAYAELHAGQYLVDENSWFRQEYILKKLPKDRQKTKNLTNGKIHNFQDSQFQYYIKVLERLPEGKIAPLTYMTDQISRVLLHERKIKLLRDLREEIYEREINRNTIKVYQ